MNVVYHSKHRRLRRRQQSNCRHAKSEAEVTNNKRLRSRYCTAETITTETHEASRSLSAVAELRVSTLKSIWNARRKVSLWTTIKPVGRTTTTPEYNDDDDNNDENHDDKCNDDTSNDSSRPWWLVSCYTIDTLHRSSNEHYRLASLPLDEMKSTVWFAYIEYVMSIVAGNVQ